MARRIRRDCLLELLYRSGARARNAANTYVVDEAGAAVQHVWQPLIVGGGRYQTNEIKAVLGWYVAGANRLPLLEGQR